MSDTSRPVLTLNRKAEAEKSNETIIQQVFRRKQRIDAVPIPPTPPKKRMNIIEAPGIITRY